MIDNVAGGIIDGNRIVSALLGDGGGGDPGDNTTEPPPPGEGDWLVFERPLEDSWLVEGETYSCLLYTSPSPRDRTRSRMPSSA